MTLSDNIDSLKKDFLPIQSDSIAIYKKILEIGNQYKGPDITQFQHSDTVKGCQSLMYMKSRHAEGKIYFDIFSDALISKGVAAILVSAYSGETPETILKNKPSFLKDLGITESLSPSRSNGALALFTKMQQSAIYHLTKVKL
ncbi:MAG: Cysteine desulfuration protein SufE [Chlamydiia bacterium]|nr:Cysteine desulfuration protein SufE [Chlamydiia bacterium]